MGRKKRTPEERAERRATYASLKRQLAMAEGQLASALQERNKLWAWAREQPDPHPTYNGAPLMTLLQNLATDIKERNEEIRSLKERMRSTYC